MRLAKELTPSSSILRNQTSSPNCAIGFLHLRLVLLISLVFPSLPILILFMTCAAKTRKPTEQWTVICDTYTCVLFSGNWKTSTLSFSLISQPFPHDRWPCRWSLQNHSHSTCVNHRILECFRTRFIIAYQNESAKTKIFDETHKK